MNLRDSVRISLRSIRSHKLRSALTTLGIVIGIAAVITFVTLGTSLKAEVVGEIGTAQADKVYLVATPEEEGGPPASLAQPVFTEHDIGQLREVEGVDRVIPRGQVPTASVRHGEDTIARNRMTATTPALLRDATFLAGGPFEPGQREVVLNRAAASLFADNVSVGDDLTIARRSGEEVTVTVVGVLDDDSGLNPLGGFGAQPRFYLPTDPFYDTVGESPSVGVRQRVYPQVTVVAADPTATAAVKARVEASLPDSDAVQLAPEGYEVTARTNEDIVDRVARVVDRITGAVTGIAVISLIVGAIGIANVMLVSVTERTKEIGIMKAVGARNRDVLQLFLVESIVLGLLGVAIGVPLGLAGGYVATRYAEISTLVLAPEWVAIAVVVGVVVGAAAGLYPAYRAAAVDPIDALRYE